MLIAPFTPSWHKISNNSLEQVRLTGLNMLHTRQDPAPGGTIKVIQDEPEYHILAFCIVASGMLFYSSFKGKDRIWQMKLGVVNTLLIGGALISIFLAISKGEKWMDPMVFGERQFGFLIPFLALFLNMFSNRLIQRDERLVRSMHRMR